jgi:hypothetical protein
VKAVAAVFVEKAKRNAGNRQPAGLVVELYVSGSGNGSGQVRGCDCDWDDYGSCDSSGCGWCEVEVADGHKHDCNPDHFEIIAISMRIGK